MIQVLDHLPVLVVSVVCCFSYRLTSTKSYRQVSKANLMAKEFWPLVLKECVCVCVCLTSLIVLLGLSHLGRNAPTGMKRQIMTCVSSGPSRSQYQDGIRNARNFLGKMPLRENGDRGNRGG